MPDAFPEEWHEVENQDHIVEKYRARNPTLFVREAHDVGVHVLPVSPSSPHEPEAYEVAAIRGSGSNFEAEHAIETVEDRVAAFERAEAFADAYEDAYRRLDSGDGKWEREDASPRVEAAFDEALAAVD